MYLYIYTYICIHIYVYIYINIYIYIYIYKGRLITDLYCKPIDGYQYIHYDSCHADHIKRSIIFSRTLRLKRICSEKSNLNVHDLNDLKT